MKAIDLVYVNAGGGHRSAATALETAIREQGRDWRVRLVNLFEVLDPQDVFRRTTGVKPEDYYNVRLARGWTLGLAQELRILQVLIRLSHKSLVAQLRRHWLEQPARSGGIADPELQPRHVPGPASRLSAGPLCDRAHRSRGFPAALLDRAASSAACHLRHGARGCPGACHRRRSRAGSPHLGHDHQSGFLP